jgi:tRNA uridine 5-carboxymethylaminomethyl modification enzyme
VDRQNDDVAVLRRDEKIAIPVSFDYAGLSGLSVELRQKLEHRRPASIAHAGQIDGMTPAALMLILAHVKRGQRQKSA